MLAHADVPRYPDADLRALEPYAKGRTLEEGTDLLSHVGLDSIQAMKVLLAAEGRFDMSIPLNMLAEVRTVGDLAQQLQHLLERR